MVIARQAGSLTSTTMEENMEPIQILSPIFTLEVGENIEKLGALMPEVTLFCVTVHIPIVVDSKN